MKKVFKKMVGLLMAVMMIGSILVGSVSAAEVQKVAPTLGVMSGCGCGYEYYVACMSECR